MSLREFVVSNHLLGKPDELRARLGEEGYLFFRGLVPQDDVLQVRRAILECCREAGWLIEGSDLLEGRADVAKTCVDLDPAYVQVYQRVLRLEVFHTLAHHPAVLGVISAVLGEPAVPHPLKIARLMFPQNVAYTTPAHQDFVFIQGTPETYTCWMPLGNCPPALGGLKVNPATHRSGLYKEYHIRTGPGGMGIDEEALPDRWLSTDYQPGDALIFHSFLVHQALPNLTADRLRLSVDYRYQAASQPISEISVKPHGSLLTWEEVYRDWKSMDLQYYWQKLNLTVASHSREFVQTRNDEAFELARQGNPIARRVLLGIAERDTDPARREQAREALAALDRVLAVGAPSTG
ncbi:MAG: phytanoyl-CoA dioxygenase family protein [Chloroflexi bacterium]|nr:phytanoyl-CoA dioxygenase family protein [Chloroflexota bacterium]